MFKKLFIFTALFVFGLFIFYQIGKSYDDKTTHPALTDEIVDFYNASFAYRLTAEEKEWIVQGAIDEDLPPRWVNHFYDPINNEGWKSEDLGWLSSATLRFISRLFLNSNTEIVSSKQWARDEALQLRYSNYGGNNTWDNALRQYAKGNKKEAYYILGHILHLLEDATVPDHTRNDTHAHEGSSVSEDGGSPYEDYGKNFNRQNLMTAQDLLKAGKRPVLLSSIEAYFDELAKYSNGYFFSEDTINKKYSNPKIIREDKNYGYGKDNIGNEFALAEIKLITKEDFSIEKIYTLRNKDVLSSYFSRLTQEAVANGAGAIKLFHNEAEKIATGKIQLPDEPQVSWWQAEMRSPAYGALAVYNNAASVTNQVYIVSKEMVFAVKDATAQAMSATANFFSRAVSIPLSFLSASIGSIPAAQQMSEQAPALQASAPVISSKDINVAVPQATDVVLPEPKQEITASVSAASLASSPVSDFTIYDVVNVSIPDVDRPNSVEKLSPTPDSLVLDAGNATTTNLWISDVDRLTATTTAAVTVAEIVATTTNETIAIQTYQGGGWSSGVAVADSVSAEAKYMPDIDLASATTSNDNIATSTEQIIATTTEEIIYSDPVVINEIAWMGTRAQANDEWIEFYNKTGKDIDLTGWTLESKNKSLSINLTGIIKAGSCFILERTASTTTDQPEDMIFTGAINNSGSDANLYLKNGSTTIDFVDFGYWPAGDNTNKKTMERVSLFAEGNNYYNWKTYSEISAPPFAKDAAGNNIFGTPGAKNSATGRYVPAALSITQNTTWRKVHSPYFVASMMTIAASSTLTIEPGVVVKIAKGAPYGGGINVNGILKAEGTETEPIVFTSSVDDAADGVDVNQDGASTVPAAGDWMNINFFNSTQLSSLKYVKIRYGGQGTNHNPNGWYPTYTGVISIQNSSPLISNAQIENNKEISVYIKGSARPIIKNSIIRNSITGMHLADASSSAEIIGNTFENNSAAIRSDSASGVPLVVKDNIFINNNKNGIFTGLLNFNLDNSNNRDQNQKGGFDISINIARGQSKTLKADTMPYTVSWFNIEEGGELSVEPGVVLKMSNGSSLPVKGVLRARGIAGKPIIFTSLLDDSGGYDSDNSTSVPQEGNWKNIQFIGASSSDSILEYVEIKYGGRGADTCPYAYLAGPCMAYEGALLIDGSSPVVNNVTLDRNLAIAIYIKGDARPAISDSAITNTKEAMKSPGSTIGGFGVSVGAESSPTFTNNTYGGNAQNVVYR